MADGKHFLRSGTLEHKRDMLDRKINSNNLERGTGPAHIRSSNSLTERKNIFAERVKAHQKKMETNPFSGDFKSRRQQPTLAKDDPNYGKPVAGSKSERRGLAAAARINAEVAELCSLIYMEGEQYDDGTAAIAFGDLFQIYTRISNKVVGILLRARKHGLLDFEGEVLFQGRDNGTPILLLKPIQEIKNELAQDTEFEVGVCHKAKQ